MQEARWLGSGDRPCLPSLAGRRGQAAREEEAAAGRCSVPTRCRCATPGTHRGTRPGPGASVQRIVSSGQARYAAGQVVGRRRRDRLRGLAGGRARLNTPRVPGRQQRASRPKQHTTAPPLLWWHIRFAGAVSSDPYRLSLNATETSGAQAGRPTRLSSTTALLSQASPRSLPGRVSGPGLTPRHTFVISHAFPSHLGRPQPSHCNAGPLHRARRARCRRRRRRGGRGAAGGLPSAGRAARGLRGREPLCRQK